MLRDYLPVNLNGAGNSSVAAGNAKQTYFCTFRSLIHMQTARLCTINAHFSKHLLKWIFLKDSSYCVNMSQECLGRGLCNTSIRTCPLYFSIMSMCEKQ